MLHSFLLFFKSISTKKQLENPKKTQKIAKDVQFIVHLIVYNGLTESKTHYPGAKDVLALDRKQSN